MNSLDQTFGSERQETAEISSAEWSELERIVNAILCQNRLSGSFQPTVRFTADVAANVRQIIEVLADREAIEQRVSESIRATISEFEQEQLRAIREGGSPDHYSSSFAP